jgi:archaemetzincin
MKSIHILPFGDIEEGVTDKISEKLIEAFDLPCRVLPSDPAPEHAYDPKRRQYLSTRILKKLNDEVPVDALKVLGVVDVDLCTPILTFVFGEAQLKGKCAVMSLWRLRPENEGEKDDPNIFRSRFEKEAIHELAHTFGLRHCSDVNCVMHASNSIYDTDVKADTFCPSCRWLLDVMRAENLKQER